MGKIRDQADDAARRASQELSDEEERERRGAEHFRERGLSTPWRLAPVIAQAADGAVTYRNLKSGGEEYNPRLRGLAKASPLGLAAVKVAQGVATQALANHIHKKSGNSKVGRVAAKVLSAGSTAQGLYGAGYGLAHLKGKKK